MKVVYAVASGAFLMAGIQPGHSSLLGAAVVAFLASLDNIINGKNL